MPEAAGVMPPPAPPRAPTTARLRDPALGLLAIPAVVLLLLALSWKENRPIGQGALLTSIGQVTGLVGAVLALCAVALMARVPVVTEGLGADRTVTWHRAAATATMVLLAVHVPATALGYAAADGSPLGAEITTLLGSYPDMLTATAAFVLLVLISVSSIRGIKQRLPYESWLFGHWYAYLAVALAFGHELSTGASFVAAPWPTMAWTWLHLVVAGLVLWYRVVLPAWRMGTRRIEVLAVEAAGGGAAHLWLHGPDLAAYGAEPGQHARVRFFDAQGWWQSHPFSLSAMPEPDRWRITIAPSGDHTRQLTHIAPGTRVGVSEVAGTMTTLARERDAVVLIAGGAGITPLRAVLEALPATTDVRVLYRARAPQDLIVPAELDALARAHGTHVDYLLGPRHADPDQDLLAPVHLHASVPDLAERSVFVCGHAGFVHAVERSLHALGVPRRQIHTERFDP